MKTLPNVHPGEILLEEFLNPMDISQNRLARAMVLLPQQTRGYLPLNSGNESIIPHCQNCND